MLHFQNEVVHLAALVVGATSYASYSNRMPVTREALRAMSLICSVRYVFF